MKLKGKTVLITGAAKRIGRALALDCAKQGADLIIHYNRAAPDARRLQREAGIFGSKVTLIQADFSKRPTEAMIRRMVQKIYAQVRHIDVLINNASAFLSIPFGKVRERDWETLMTVNLKVPFFLSQMIGERMKKRGSGKIINFVDHMMVRPPASFLAHAISKGGLQTATIGLARALAPEVQVNSILPGPILPPPWGMSAKQKKSVADQTLLKRFGTPEDLAAAVRFLIEGTDYATGVMLPVDGGISIA